MISTLSKKQIIIKIKPELESNIRKTFKRMQSGA